MYKQYFRGLLTFFFALFLFTPTIANAELIYSTFGPNNTFGVSCWLIGSLTPEKANQQEVGAFFIPTSDYYLDSIDFAARYFAYDNQLTVYIASGVAVPSAPIEAYSFTGLSTGVYTAYSISRPLLRAGTKYFVVLTADDLLNTEMGWWWSSQGFYGGVVRTQQADWTSLGGATPAFAVYGTPPFSIDINPGSSPNNINLKSKGKIPVAILSTQEFYAPDMVNKDSLTFGYTGVEDSLAFCNPKGEDVNGDGLKDLVCHFYTQETKFQCGDTEGILMGETVDGTPIEGKDSVSIAPCK